MGRKGWRLLGLAGLLLVATFAGLALGGALLMIRMPGQSFRGDPPPLTVEERALARALRADVEHLAVAIGPRHAGRDHTLDETADWITARFESMGQVPARLPYDFGGERFFNIEVEVPGRDRPEEIVVIGAHYDSVPQSPGADDNASGVAAMLALADRMGGEPQPRTVRFVAFANEEQPFFQSEGMGSLVYARRSRQRGDAITAMLSLESIGYYDEAEGSQSYPPLVGRLYPSRGDFLGFVGNIESRGVVREAIAAFRQVASLPSEGAALPGWVSGVGWSDHWAFWQAGYPAAMVTGTAPFRNPHYHLPTDTPATLDFERLARAVVGLEASVRALAAP